MKAFLLYGHAIGIKGLDNNFINDIIEHPYSVKGTSTLKPVESNDLFDGPFSDLELENIIAKSLRFYVNNLITLEHYTALMFFAQTGRRAIQATDLKICDLEEVKSSEGISTYYVNVPRRKQRGQTFRASFNKTLVDQDLWALLNLQAKEVKNIVIKKFIKIDRGILDNLPIFPSHKITKIDNQSDLIRQLGGDSLHIRSAYLSSLVTSSTEIFNITSERTNSLLKITPKRFRHTIGTNSAREGYGARVIAEILDHTTDVVAGVYTKNTPDIVKRLDRGLAMQLAPLAQAFSGVLIKNESEAKRANDPSSRVSNGKSNLGSCGNYGFCSASAPVACYTCQQFQPWLHAPHEDVLNHLLEERDRIQGVTGDNRIASVNDRLILAVTEVIQRCEEQNSFGRERESV